MLTENNSPGDRTAPPCPPGTLLGTLAQQLTRLGLDIREHHRDGQLIEIAATSPHDPDQGRVVISYDGYLTLERCCSFRTSDDVQVIAHTIGVLLHDNLSQQFQAAHHQPANNQPGHTLTSQP
jgi:hypothetical protein